MDVSKVNSVINSGAGSTMRVVYAGKDQGATITCLGREARVVRDVAERIDREHSVLGREPSASEINRKAREIVFAAVQSWEGIMDNGAIVECTPENVRRILGADGMEWLVLDILKFMGGVENFYKDTKSA